MAPVDDPLPILVQLLPVGPAEEALLRAYLVPRTVPRHGLLVRQGQPCRELLFVQQGSLRSYYTTEHGEVTCWAALPGEFMTSLTAFLSQGPSPENIQALEPTRVLALARANWQRLHDEQPAFRERWRTGIEARYAELETRLGVLRALRAAERYAFVQHHHPDLVRHVPLQYLASILGIEPRHLSRIRAGTQR